MTTTNVSDYQDLYMKYLNLPHRRLIVDDSYRLISTPPQKKVYPSSGCLFLRCPFLFCFMTCDNCLYSYDFREL